MRNKVTKDVVGAPIASEGWQAIFFDLDGEGFVDEEEAGTIRVACWVNLGGRIVGLIPTTEGLKPAEEEENFRGYVDVMVKDSFQKAIDAWDKEVEEEQEEGD